MIAIDIACNDPENGCFMHRAEGITIGCAEFEPKNWRRPPTLVELPSAIRLAGKRWDIYSAVEYCGNWCWNRYVIASPAEIPKGRFKTPGHSAVDFMKWLRGRNLFEVTTAPEALFDWWRGERGLSDAEIHTALHEACE